MALAVSLDIVNAFTLQWEGGNEGSTRIVTGASLPNCKTGDQGLQGCDITQERETFCGVSQGSVLGPILWDLAYDVLLRAVHHVGVSVTRYAGC